MDFSQFWIPAQLLLQFQSAKNCVDKKGNAKNLGKAPDTKTILVKFDLHILNRTGIQLCIASGMATFLSWINFVWIPFLFYWSFSLRWVIFWKLNWTELKIVCFDMRRKFNKILATSPSIYFLKRPRTGTEGEAAKNNCKILYSCSQRRETKIYEL